MEHLTTSDRIRIAREILGAAIGTVQMLDDKPPCLLSQLWLVADELDEAIEFTDKLLAELERTKTAETKEVPPRCEHCGKWLNCPHKFKYSREVNLQGVRTMKTYCKDCGASV